MVYKVLKSILLLLLITQTTGQFFDFFSQLQPVIQRPIQTDRHQYEVTTKRVRTQKPTQARTDTSRRNHALSFSSEEIERDRNRRLKSPSFETQTSHINNSYSSDYRPKTTIGPRQENSRTTQKSKRKNSSTQSSRIYFNNDRNTIVHNKQTDPTTQNPFLNRPGVKPAVVNGPPITNKPPTHLPLVEDSSPELIIGPDEDYMSSTDRRRHIEIAERMCDKYKAQDVKQLQAIPLVPSPRPVKVNVSSCVPSEVPLVVGGKVVSIREFPHMALLGWPKMMSSGYSWKCGGSLLSDQYVLTAAHCAYQEKDNSVATGPPRAVQLGSSFLNDPGALVIKVASVTRHPKYKLPKSYFDIALVKMVKIVAFSEVIKPACLGTAPSPGNPVIATGWGRTEFGGDQSLELRSVSIPVWEIPQCRDVLGTSRKLPDGPLSDSQICAGEMNGGKDTCQGDSGGPAQIQDGCIWRVVAVTSLGRSCGAPRTPALYAIVHPAFISAVVFNGQTNKQDSSTSQDNYNQVNSGSNNYGNQNRRDNVETTTIRRYSSNNNQQNYNSGSNRNDNKHNQQGSGNYNYYNENRRDNVETTTIRRYSSNNNQQNYNSGSNRNDNKHNQLGSGNYNYSNENRRDNVETTTIRHYGSNKNQQNYNSGSNRNDNKDNQQGSGNYNYGNQNRRPSVESSTVSHYSSSNNRQDYDSNRNDKNHNRPDSGYYQTGSQSSDRGINYDVNKRDGNYNQHDSTSNSNHGYNNNQQNTQRQDTTYNNNNDNTYNQNSNSYNKPDYNHNIEGIKNKPQEYPSDKEYYQSDDANAYNHNNQNFGYMSEGYKNSNYGVDRPYNSDNRKYDDDGRVWWT